MSGPIMCFFLRILEISSHSLPNNSNKVCRFSSTRLWKIHKFLPWQKVGAVAFDAMIELWQMIQDLVFKEWHYKVNPFSPIGAGSVKKVLALSREAILFHVRNFIIKIELLSLQGSFVDKFLLYGKGVSQRRSSAVFQISFYKLEK